jgi:Nif-specific regulatory protein
VKGLINRRFKLIKSLGAGGMGEVFLVEDSRNEQSYALKILSPETTPETENALVEFRLLSRLDHPNLVKVYECGVVRSGPRKFHKRLFFIMEALTGVHVGSLKRPKNTEDATALWLTITEKVLQSLAVIHRLGIIHRDLKSENIFVCDDHNIKVLDFGLAATTQERSPTLGSDPGSVGSGLSGSIGYWAPELRRGASCDIRSDLYALGVTLYRLATGRFPDMQHPIPLRDQCPWLPSRWLEGVEALLSPEPSDRPANAVAAATIFGLPIEAAERAQQRPRGPLVGRVDEHKAILDFIKENRGSSTWITGESGLGKSRLCEELATSLRLRGLRVCHLTRPAREPYSGIRPLFQLLRKRHPPKPDHEQAVQMMLQESATSSHWVRPRADEYPNSSVSDPKLIFFDQLTHYLLHCCKHRKMVLLADNAGQLDPSSREFIAYVLRAARVSQAEIHGVFADRERLDSLAQNALQIELEPLNPEQSLVLACALVPDQEAARLFAEKSGGYPDALVTLASGEDTPQIHHERIVQGLSLSARSCLLSSILLARSLTLAEFSQFSVTQEKDAVTAISQLLEQGLLRRHGGAGTAHYTLTLPVLGQAILSQFDDAFVAAQRLKLFQSLSKRKGRLSELARLAVHVKAPNLVELCKKAAVECLAIHAYEDAEIFLRQSLKAVETPDQTQDLQQELLDLLHQQGKLAEAENLATEILDAGGPPIPVSRVCKTLAKILRSKGALSKAKIVVERGLALIENCPDDAATRNLRAEFQLLESRLASTAGNYQTAAAICQRARSALTPTERDGPLGLRIEVEQSNNEVLTLDRKLYPEAGARLQRALKRLELLNDKDGLLLTLRALGLHAFYAEDGLSAERYYQKALEYTGPSGPIALGLLNNLAMVANRWGDPSIAEWRLKECLTSAERMGAWSVVCRAYTNLGRLRREQGDPRGSIQALQRAAETSFKAEEPIIESAALSELGALYRKQGSIKKALAAYRRGRQRRLEMGDPARVASSEWELGQLWEETGDIAAAIEHYRLAIALNAHRDDVESAAPLVEMLICCGTRPGGAAALLKSVRSDHFQESPPEIAQSCEFGLWCADMAVCLAAVIALREAGDLTLSRTLFEAILHRRPEHYHCHELATALETLAAALNSEGDLADRRTLVVVLDTFVATLPKPLPWRIILLKAKSLIGDHEFDHAVEDLKKIPESADPEIILEKKFWLARIRTLAPQLSGLELDTTARSQLQRCVSDGRDLRKVALVAQAASDLSNLEAARGQGNAAQAATVIARDAAQQATLFLPQTLKESWLARLLTPSTEVVAMSTGPDRLIPMLERVLASDLSLEPLLDLIIALLLEASGAERGFLILKEKSGAMAFRSSRNISAAEVMSARGFRGSYGIAEEVARSGQTILIADASIDRRFASRESLRDHKIRSVLAAPIILGGDTLAVVYLDHSKIVNCFGDDALDLVRAFTSRVATTIRHSRDQAEAVRQAEKRAETYLKEIQRLGSRRPLLLGESHKLREVRDLIDRFASATAPVLIVGESGTGKEIVARSLHLLSSRHDGPFMAVNCAAFSEEILDAELFGYRKGAFTGAIEDRAGVIESADGGTLFLDEVGDMGPPMQVKLLRVLASSELRRIGEHRTRRVSVRVVAATHQNLETMLTLGQFREDLYYRLNVLKVQLPPLRERREDIPLLASHFLEEADSKRNLRLSPAVLKILYEQNYPGNVRELRNMILRAATLCSGTVVRPEHLMLEKSESRRDSESYDGEHSSPLNSRQRAVLQELQRRGGYITTKDHCAQHKVSDRTGLRDLKELVEVELLQKKGSRKSARYSLPE